jgi:hypothetical protein
MLDTTNYSISLPETLDPLLAVNMLYVLAALAFKLDTGLCCFVQVISIVANSKEMYEHVLKVRPRNEPVCVEVADIHD